MTNETAAAANLALSVSISKGSDIADFFSQKTNMDFIDWFNANCANKSAWAGKAIGNTPEVKSRFNRIWDQFPLMFATNQINLVQFVSLTSIFINEVGGEMLPLTERIGRINHPALAYPFDTIAGVKRSYNQAPNKTAFELFNDNIYIQAHGQLAQAERLINTTDSRWRSSVYPQNDFPTSADAAESGFIREADFFKFRGRGFIQTTWRSNYILLIKFIQSYTGLNPTVLRYKTKWAGQLPDNIATTSTNDDWDDLFQHSDLIIPCAGIREHNKASGNYLALSSDLMTIIGTGQGSIFRMGLKISGSTVYARLYQKRVFQTILTLNKQP